MLENLVQKTPMQQPVIGDCDLCGSKQVSCVRLKLRDNVIAAMSNDEHYKKIHDMAIRGTEKCVCYACVLDLLTETVFKYEMMSSEKTTVKPVKQKKIKSEPEPEIIKEPPFDVDAYKQKMYIDYRLKGYSNIQIAKKLKMTENGLNEKIEMWMRLEDEEIRNRDDITDVERACLNEYTIKFYKAVHIYE